MGLKDVEKTSIWASNVLVNTSSSRSSWSMISSTKFVQDKYLSWTSHVADCYCSGWEGREKEERKMYVDAFLRTQCENLLIFLSLCLILRETSFADFRHSKMSESISRKIWLAEKSVNFHTVSKMGDKSKIRNFGCERKNRKCGRRRNFEICLFAF